MLCVRLCTACMLLTSGIASAARADDVAESRPLPACRDEGELEDGETRIGTVTVRDLPIFDPGAPGEGKALYRLADRLHVDTRDSVIAAQLLFRQGDPFACRSLEETERNLRQLRFIREPEIRIVGHHDGLVDLEVTARDVWTTNPGISFGRNGGKNSASIELEELNLFGRGKHLAFDYSNDVDRSSTALTWRDPSVLGSRWRDEVVLRDSDDGSGQSLVIERPFYSLDARWSAGLQLSQDNTIEHVYRLGEQTAGYGQDTESAEAQFGWSRGLRDGWTRRITAGLRHDRAAFELAPGETDLAVLPEDRDLVYPFLRIEGVQDDFETARNRDQISRTEDLQFGLRYALQLGWADPAIGSDRSAALLRAEAGRGFRLGDERSLFLHTSLGGRIENQSVVDGLLTGGIRFYRKTGPRSTFYAALHAEFGHALDADHELSIGGDSGLRGYPLRYQTGSGRALLTLEQRIYTSRSLWKLADIGGAVFFDAGQSWGESAFGPTENLGLLKDVGVGLRFGSTRSALANVLHVDLAFPLDGPSSINSVQLLIQTKRSF